MTASLAAARESIKKLVSQKDLDTKNGISLLSVKHHILLSYLQSLVLVTSHRVLGHTLTDRSPPPQPFSSPERTPRGAKPGDFVDNMVEGRIVLEKVKALENKMRYQIDKLVRLAEESPKADGDEVVNDPLAFGPNPQNLMDQGDSGGEGAESGDGGDDGGGGGGGRGDGIYRPPRLAPVPYTEERKGKKDRRAPIPSALAQLSHLDPHIESTSGLGAMPTLQSSRARELARMTEFEEENFTRLVMKKKDAKRRRRDEEDVALGGTGALAGRRRAAGAGLEDEFADVLRAVGRKRDGKVGDGYEELRMRAKKGDLLERARTRPREDVEEGPREKKKGRFEKERKTVTKKLAGKMRR
ncbi:hypothetical protein BD410DRAFT_713959 [Rickenella mellea]|uniref:Uncharacterized protein n=1 Tax=Rickenella mellea TaxID=50990 RepID=A0A4Y7QLC1_9AGAM|nr:hypothetical protein BD410DRAFT_713959 [Rickenella mellea]